MVSGFVSGASGAGSGAALRLLHREPDQQREQEAWSADDHESRAPAERVVEHAASIGAALSFNVVPAACLGSDGKSNCVGANMITLFTGGAPNPQSVSAFNQKYVFTSAGMYSDGSGAFLSRYDIADYGIPRGNVASSIYNYFTLAQRFRDEIATKTVSADGYADDLSAAALTVESGKAMGFDVAVASDATMAGVHRASLEATPELVRKLLASENAPRNKIANIRE